LELRIINVGCKLKF